MSSRSGRPTQLFQSFWLGDRLSPLEHLCIQSFVAHGHQLVLYTYDEVANVPPGCRVEDARAILGEEHVFLQRSSVHKGGASPFSDRFRYELLRARGGWWVDTDVLCLTDEIPEVPYAFAKQDQDLYNNAILKVPAESAFLSEAIARCEHYGKDVEFGTIGPDLVTELVRKFGLEGHAWAREQLYPLGWSEALTCFDPAQADRIEALVESSTFVHFYTNMLRLANVLKDIGPPEGSYLDRLYATYDIELPYGRRYDWSEIEPQSLFEAKRWALFEEVEHLRAEVQRLEGQRERQAVGESDPHAPSHQLAMTQAQLERFEQSVTIQLFCRLRDRFYGTIGRRSLLARAIQASLRLIGRWLIPTDDHPKRDQVAPDA